MRVAVDLRSLLDPYESGVSVYTKAMVDELFKLPQVELDLFYQARTRCAALHERYPSVRQIPISNRVFNARCLFGFPSLPADCFPIAPDLIWLPDRRPFYKTSIPVVMTVHDQVPERFGYTLSVKSWVWHRLFPLTRLTNLCSGLLFTSLTVAQGLRSHLPWEVTYEGAQLSATVTRPAGVPRGEFVLSLAPLDPRKRLLWVFQLARLFPKVTFVCAGLKAKDARFSRMKIPSLPNVRMLSAVTEAEKTWLFRHACVLLSLSMEEGFDLPVLEAVSAKLPVILSDIPVHRELYKKATFVKDFTALRAALYSVLQDDGLVPEPRGDYSWPAAARRASLFFLRVLRDENRKHAGYRNGHDHSHNA